MKKSAKGFSLLELSVVLIIIGLVAAMAANSGMGVISAARISATRQKMAVIDQALLAYRSANNRLPCPADITIADGGTNFGVEGATPGTCTGGTPAANRSAAGATNTMYTGVEGALPVVTLGLPNDFMYDGWGRRMHYVVDTGVTGTNAFSNIASACQDRAITVKDASGATRSSGAIYALISHGENGHGGYNKNGTVYNAGSTNTDEQTNCHCTSAAVASTYAPTYVQKDATLNTSDINGGFDDIVTYKERWQMIVAWEKPGACSYEYVLDQGNNRIQKFDGLGNYISTPGSSLSGATNEYVTLNSSGLLFISDFSNGRVIEEQSDGTIIQYIGSGTLSATEQEALDSSGNLWVTDGNNARVVKFNITGSISSVALTIPASCTSPCSPSDADGAFRYPEGIFIDSSNNVWVTDYSTNKIQKFDSSGNLLLVFGSWGSSNGQFNGATGISVDSSGNIWVADSGNNRVQKFNSSGVYQSQLGCATGACTASSANGQFNLPGLIKIDSSGNLWVNDINNNRIQKFNSSGVYQLQIGCATGGCSSGSATGQFNAPTGLATSNK